MNGRLLKYFLLPVWVIVLLSACGGITGSSKLSDDETFWESDNIISQSKLLDIKDYAPGVTLVRVSNPWDSLAAPQLYLLMEEGATLPADAPKEALKVNVPVKRSVVESALYADLLGELGALPSVTGICDASFACGEATAQRIRNKSIADCGLSTNPNIEEIVRCKPDVIILSPLEGGAERKQFSRAGIPIVEMYDYLESSPLARAEWMRFIGRLYGKGAEADSLYSAVEKSYLEIKNRASAQKGERPMVLTDMIYGQSWSAPTSGSATGILIADAGGVNPFSKYTERGSAQLAPEKVLHIAQNADIWLIRHYNPPVLTLASIKKENPIYGEFEPWKRGNVYGANTLTSRVMEDGAFHPERVLAEIAELISAVREHREAPADKLRYFYKIK